MKIPGWKAIVLVALGVGGPAIAGVQQAAGADATLTARLVDADRKAAQRTATVEVRVAGVALVDPGKAKEQPHKGQAHLHYQVDNGFVIATTASKLSFHELTAGRHKITVVLAANDHTPLGPQRTLDVAIP